MFAAADINLKDYKTREENDNEIYNLNLKKKQATLSQISINHDID